jgi:hypothetical protein
MMLVHIDEYIVDEYMLMIGTVGTWLYALIYGTSWHYMRCIVDDVGTY